MSQYKGKHFYFLRNFFLINSVEVQYSPSYIKLYKKLSWNLKFIYTIYRYIFRSKLDYYFYLCNYKNDKIYNYNNKTPGRGIMSNSFGFQLWVVTDKID